MGLELYSRQAQVSHADDRCRAAVILPTGTGKCSIPFPWDECRRGPGKQRGAAVQLRPDSHPRPKLPGLPSARMHCLDHRHCTAGKLPDNCINAEMTLGEAIVRGILLPPELIAAVLPYQKRPVRYERQTVPHSKRGLQALCRGAGQAGRHSLLYIFQ